MHVGCGESRRSVVTRLVPHGVDRARRVESPRRRHAESLLLLRADGGDHNWPTPSPTSNAPMTMKTTVMMVLFLCTSQVRAVLRRSAHAIRIYHECQGRRDDREAGDHCVAKGESDGRARRKGCGADDKPGADAEGKLFGVGD